MAGIEAIGTAKQEDIIPVQEVELTSPDKKSTFEKIEKTVELYFRNPDIHFNFKPGGFYINLETLVVNLDPDFTKELNLGDSGMVFGAFHEAEHFRDMLQDVDAYKKHFDRLKQLEKNAKSEADKAYVKSLSRFYNILDDVAVNRAVQGRWHACSPTYLANLYKKLFPDHDYSKEPEHDQFANALIRELMASDEECLVSPKVRVYLDKHKTTVEAVSRFDLNKNSTFFNPATRYAILRSEVEPIFKELFTYKPKERSPGDSGNVPSEAPPGTEGAPSLDQIDHDELFKAIQDIQEKIKEKKNNVYEKLLGVSKEEKDAYDQLYRSIEPQVREVVDLFKQFISTRVTEVRTKKIRTEGELMSSRLNEAYIRAQAGELDQARVFERKVTDYVEKPIFTDFELTIVIDGSGSMQDPEKLKAQQKATIMLLEAIVQFQSEVNDLAKQGDEISMDLKTKIHEFSDKDAVIKDFNQELDYKSRVAISNRLNNLSGGGNNEIHTLDAILSDVQEKKEEIQTGELKKLIIVLTDGESDKDIKGKIAQIYRMSGNVPNMKIMGVGLGAGTESVTTTYEPNGKGDIDLKDLPKHLAESLIAFIAS